MTFDKYSDYEIKAFLLATSFGINSWTKKNINDLYTEAYNRHIARPDVLLNMHSWSLFHINKGTQPHYRVDLSGNYWRRAN